MCQKSFERVAAILAEQVQRHGILQGTRPDFVELIKLNCRPGDDGIEDSAIEHFTLCLCRERLASKLNNGQILVGEASEVSKLSPGSRRVDDLDGYEGSLVSVKDILAAERVSI